jgi:cytochrome c-type biogenesis protein CcmE
VNRVRRNRLLYVAVIFIGGLIAGGLIVYALGQNINAFYSPSQVVAGEVAPGQVFRLGGVVEAGSVVHQPDALEVNFNITDFQDTISVSYNGILPDLFREGQGIVAQGQINEDGTFIADQVLAKHDSTYMPAEVERSLRA